MGKRKNLTVHKTDVTLIHGDCIEEIHKFDKGIVDLIAVDLPYGTTQNKWDTIIPFEDLWKAFYYIIKPNGVIALTATQPFTSKLVMSNTKYFKYDIIWEKTIGSGQLNINKMPLRVHEAVLIFYKSKPIYNEQKTKGNPYEIKRKTDYSEGNYGSQKDHVKVNYGFRHAKSVIKISNPRIKGGHPTQKPVELMEYIVKTYSNEGSLVLDCCMGHGTTGVACVNLGRDFIGMEINKNYFDMAVNKINEVPYFWDLVT